MPSDPASTGVVVELRGFGYAYAGGPPVLRDIDLRIAAGECHCLTGDTGSGKSTLALALKGLLPAGVQRGEVRFTRPQARVGIVLQNPETQLLATTVGAEVAFGLENLCVPPAQMRGRVAAALAAAGLDMPLGRPTERLSMGQKYRLLLAASMVMQPELLVLDEPGGQLDPAGCAELRDGIDRLKRAGVAFLVCEHHPRRLGDVVDRGWALDGEGRLRAGALPDGADLKPENPPPENLTPENLTPENPKREPLPSTAAGVAPARGADSALRETPLAVSSRGLRGEGAPGETLWGDLSMSLRPGECAALCGPNGVGKTSLLRCLAGFARPRSGELSVLGGVAQTARLRGRLGCLYQDPSKQLFETTVLDEVAFSCRRLRTAGRSEKTAAHPAAAHEALAMCGLSDLARRSPHKLSYGQSHLVGIASVLAHGPELLLLDDPLAGLDTGRAGRLLELLRHIAAERGTAIVWTTHDSGAVPAWTTRIELAEPARDS